MEIRDTFRWNHKSRQPLSRSRSSPLSGTHTFSFTASTSVQRSTWRGQRRKSVSRHRLGTVRSNPADRQRSEISDIMQIVVFGWFLHDFTPHCSPQLSDKVTGTDENHGTQTTLGEKKQKVSFRNTNCFVLFI